MAAMLPQQPSRTPPAVGQQAPARCAQPVCAAQAVRSEGGGGDGSVSDDGGGGGMSGRSCLQQHSRSCGVASQSRIKRLAHAHTGVGAR